MVINKNLRGGNWESKDRKSELVIWEVSRKGLKCNKNQKSG